MEDKKWGAFSANSIARSRENGLLTALWVYKWGFTSTEILMRLLQVARTTVAVEMTKRGLLEQIKTDAGFRDRTVFILTGAGLQLAENFIEEYDEPNYTAFVLQNYTLHKTKRLPFRTLAHDLCTQHVVLDTYNANSRILKRVDPGRVLSRINPSIFLSSRELQTATGGTKDIPVYDAVMYRTTVKIEIELNHKEDLRLRQWLYLRICNMNLEWNESGETPYLYIYTNKVSVIKALNLLLSEDYVKPVTIGKAHKLEIAAHNTPKVGDKSLIGPLRGQIHILKLEKDETRKSGGYRIPTEE